MTGVWQYVSNGGNLEEVTLEGVMESGSVTPLVFDPNEVPVTPPPPPATRRLGAYNGGWTDFSGDPDGNQLTNFGRYPGIASTYYTTNQQTLNVAKETSRVNRGISPLIDLTTNGTQRLVGIAGIGSTVTADRAWLDQALDALKLISEADPNVPVYFALDQEWDVRTTDHTATGGKPATITGAAADPATYGQALSYMFTRMATRCPLVKKVFWYGGSSDQRTKMLTVWRSIATAFDVAAVDPYAQGGSHPGTAWTSRLDDIRTGVFSAEWTRLGKPALGISETGINKAAENDNQASAWIGNLPEAMETMDVTFCVYFNRDSGSNGDWSITSGTFMPRPLSVAAMAQAYIDVNG